jgi:glycosyltransferase involved in cell wall biosynthesis
MRFSIVLRHLHPELGKRIDSLLTPKLGLLNQYPPRPIFIPSRHLRKPRLESFPKISIVTPSLNQGRFLERTLISVLEQNYPNLEYVVQDGGSRDNSVAIIEHYKLRLHFAVSAADEGQAQAINRGFHRTSGDIMAWLNSDDVLLPGTLHYVAEYFAKHPRIDVIYSHRVLIDENDLEVGRWLLPPHRDEAFIWIDYVPQETMFWRRCAWERAGGALDPAFQFALDWDLLFRFRNSGARFARVPRFFAAFRVHPHQKTSARMKDLGAGEIEHIRRREYGRSISDTEVEQRVRVYVREHLYQNALYQLGIAVR